MNPLESLTQKLKGAFETPDVPERNRYILALRAFSDLIADMGLPVFWRRKLLDLGRALGELGEGVTPELLRPEARTDGGRPSDEWRVWQVRSRAVLAMEARLRTKTTQANAVHEIKKRFPTLGGPPYVTGKDAKLKTALRNWQRKLGDIKKGDHLDLIAEDHESARTRLAQEPPQVAVDVADTLLQYVLR